MTTPRARSPSATMLPALLAAALAAPILAAPSAARADSAASLLYERTLMDRAGTRCHLFTPEIAAALAAAGAQARGAALRGGASGDTVRGIEARAELKAYAVPCTLPDLATAADRVRKAFDGYASLRQMSYPGTLSSWQADRKPWPLVLNGKVRPGPRWRLSQAASGGATVGLTTGAGSDLVEVTTSPDGTEAAGARLILRDPAKAPDAVIDPRRRDLSGRAPPRSVTETFLARSIGPAPVSLLPTSAPSGAMIVFPPEAAKALATLDPRETATVELVFPTRTGERVETALVEVGDFAAGRAFLAAGR
jgi:hypothetical protein